METPPLTRWKQLDALLAQALDRPPDERTAFLRATCGGDPALYAEVAALLEDADAAERALGESATDYAAPLLPGLRDALAASDATGDTGTGDLGPGAPIGPYRVTALLGRGGMGTVYRAARADGAFEKTVALKVVRRGLDTDDVLARFRRERQLLASLDHPNIARLLDGGATDDGRPFLVLEHVEGEPLTDYADRKRLPVDARLRLFEQVAEAVQHAHRRLVVHRDLKPSNILVTGEGRVKLLDFGIAKLLDPEASDDAPTRTGRQPLTPAYAAPEQLAGGAITTATDVYALGALLFELLAGERPPPADPGVTAEPPSARVSDEAAGARSTTAERLRRRLRGDLDTIVLKALREDPGHRYPSVEGLLDDLRRHRAGLPVLARPETLPYRVRTFVRRHRMGVAAAAAFVALLLAALVAVSLQQRATARERDRAEAEREKAEEVAAFLESLFAATDPFAEERLDTLRVADLLGRGAARLRDELHDQPLVKAQMLAALGRSSTRLRLFDEAAPLLREALALREAHAGPASAAAAESLYDLAELYRHQADKSTADSLASRALRIRQQRFGSDHEAVAEVQALLAMVREDAGDAEGAEALLRSALRTFRATLGDADPRVAESYNRLATALLLKGDLAGTAAAYDAALALHRRHRGPRHPLLGTTLSNYAFLRIVQRDFARAEALQREAIAILEPILGPDHPRMVSVYNQLGLILRRQGRLDEAEAVLLLTLEGQRRTVSGRFSGDYTRLAATLTALSNVYLDQGRLRAAEAVQREAYEVAEARLTRGPKALYASHLSEVLRLQQRYPEAEALLLDNLRALPTDDPHTRGVSRALAALYVAWGRPEAAARWRAVAAGEARPPGAAL